jgi:hypothetical protein
MALTSLSRSQITIILKGKEDQSSGGSKLYILRHLLADQALPPSTGDDAKTSLKETDYDALSNIVHRVQIGINEMNVIDKWEAWQLEYATIQAARETWARRTDKNTRPTARVRAQRRHADDVMALYIAFGPRIALCLAEIPRVLTYYQYSLPRFRVLSFVVDPENEQQRNDMQGGSKRLREGEEEEGSHEDAQKDEDTRCLSGSTAHNEGQPNEEQFTDPTAHDDPQEYSDGDQELRPEQQPPDSSRPKRPPGGEEKGEEEGEASHLAKRCRTSLIRSDSLPASQFYPPEGLQDPTRIPHQGFNIHERFHGLLVFNIVPNIAQPSRTPEVEYLPVYLGHHNIEGSNDSFLIYRWHGHACTRSLGAEYICTSDDKFHYYSSNIEPLQLHDLSQSIQRSDHWARARAKGLSWKCLSFLLPIEPAKYGCYGLFGCIVPTTEVEPNPLRRA